MSRRPDNMRKPQGLLHALEGVGVAAPKVLSNLAAGFDLLGPTVQPAATDPANAILAAAVDGKLTGKSLDQLLSVAAAEAATINYRADFRLRAECKFAHRFHAALLEGAADEVLDSIRPLFDSTAAELTAATAAVDINSRPQHLLEVTATAEEQDAWRRLPDLVRRITQLAAIAASFGPHEELAVVDDLTQNDNLQLGWIRPQALMCCADNVVRATETFGRPNPNWVSSPWLRVTPELHTIASAQERYREVAEGDFTARNLYAEGSGRLTDKGFVPEVRANPHKLPESVKA
jgi:hypothetical protein